MQTSPEILDRSRYLRNNMTSQEKKLWFQFLRSYDVSFRRQFVKDSYILDFYCPKAKLAIEIDGGQHFTDEGLEYDAKRTEYLKSLGIEVVRVTDADVSKRFQLVCEMIDENVKRRL